MFVLTTLVYPVVLALLCVGAGLLVYRASATDLPAMLLPVIGAAALIVVSQLTTYVTPVAPATPYLLVAVALGGWVLGWGRVRALARCWRACSWQLLVGPLAYVLALAPVVLAGRPTLSSYMTLADSAVHMLGADFLIRHGQASWGQPTTTNCRRWVKSSPAISGMRGKRPAGCRPPRFRGR